MIRFRVAEKTSCWDVETRTGPTRRLQRGDPKGVLPVWLRAVLQQQLEGAHLALLGRKNQRRDPLLGLQVAIRACQGRGPAPFIAGFGKFPVRKIRL